MLEDWKVERGHGHDVGAQPGAGEISNNAADSLSVSVDAAEASEPNGHEAW